MRNKKIPFQHKKKLKGDSSLISTSPNRAGVERVTHQSKLYVPLDIDAETTINLISRSLLNLEAKLLLETRG